MNLPLIMAHVVAALLAGGLITYTGYYTPFMLISSVFVSLGTGFITTFKPDTNVRVSSPPLSQHSSPFFFVCPLLFPFPIFRTFPSVPFPDFHH